MFWQRYGVFYSVCGVFWTSDDINNQFIHTAYPNEE